MMDVEVEVVVGKCMGRNSMSGLGNKVSIGWDTSRFSLEQFNHEFMDNIDGCTIDKNFHCISCKFFFFLTIWDIPGNKSNLKIESFVSCSSVNDGFHSVTTVHSGGQVANKAG